MAYPRPNWPDPVTQKLSIENAVAEIEQYVDLMLEGLCGREAQAHDIWIQIKGDYDDTERQTIIDTLIAKYEQVNWKVTYSDENKVSVYRTTTYQGKLTFR